MRLGDRIAFNRWIHKYTKNYRSFNLSTAGASHCQRVHRAFFSSTPMLSSVRVKLCTPPTPDPWARRALLISSDPNTKLILSQSQFRCSFVPSFRHDLRFRRRRRRDALVRDGGAEEAQQRHLRQRRPHREGSQQNSAGN